MTGKNTQLVTLAKNNSLFSALQNDKIRYQRKGILGLMMALIIFMTNAYGFPLFLKQYWGQILSFGTKQQIYMLSILINHHTVLILYHCFYLFIYWAKIPFFEKARVQKKPWPWEEDHTKWLEIRKKIFLIYAINMLCVSPLAIILSTDLAGINCRMDLQSYPEFFNEILPQFIFFMIMDDIAFYFNHRFIHNPKIYPYIHKLHHEHYHCTSYSAEYAHPVEFLLGNLIPAFLGFALLGQKAHLVTFFTFVNFRVFEAIDGHSGYEFNWSPCRLLPFSASSEYHNYHHSHNIGNFSSLFTYWDTLFQTNKTYFEFKSQKEQEEAIKEDIAKEKEKKKN